jgi:ubiquinone biosynthesis accessory factor UbiJ
MLNAFFASLGAGALERITLLLNHVIASETVATDRLKPHAGRRVQLTLTGWPSMLPPPPQIAFRVTPAGLLEWCGDEPPADPPSPADLRLTLDASNPARLAAQWFGGVRPTVGIEGDSAFAADVSWLIDNLRWDLQDDLAKVIGPAPAHELSRFAAMVAGGLREAVHVLQGLVNRNGGGTPR